MAEKARWEAARLAGSYAWSTRDRTLEQEGFIHAAREEQVAGVLARHYADHPGPLVLLEIDTDLLTSPWREERVGDTTFPHVHGPLNPSAVVAVRDVPRAAGDAAPSFFSVFLGEVAFRMGVAVVVMVLALVGAWLATVAWGEDTGLLGLVAGGAAGALLVTPAVRRRRRAG